MAAPMDNLTLYFQRQNLLSYGAGRDGVTILVVEHAGLYV